MSNDPEVHAADSAEDEGRVSLPYKTPPAKVPTGPLAKVPTYPMSSMRTSPEGLAFITSVEGRGSETNGVQWPGGYSEVTVGLGYDLYKRDPREIINDLTSIGVSRDKAEILSRTSQMHGHSAKQFAEHNKNLISLTDIQKQALLKKIIGKYEKDIKDVANFPVTQYQFDALVALSYDPGGHLRVITRSIAAGNFAKAEKDWLSRTHSNDPKHPKSPPLRGLVDRRNREINLYKNGVYK